MSASPEAKDEISAIQSVINTNKEGDEGNDLKGSKSKQNESAELNHQTSEEIADGDSNPKGVGAVVSTAAVSTPAVTKKSDDDPSHTSTLTVDAKAVAYDSTLDSELSDSKVNNDENAKKGNVPSGAPDAANASATANGTDKMVDSTHGSRPLTPVHDDNVTILIRPQDEGWVMGEDWSIRFPYQHTLNQLKAYIEEHRGISRHRMQLRLRKKILMPNRENWTVIRYGIYDGYVICVEPTLSGSWLWNPIEYYENKLIEEILAIVDQQPGQRIALSSLEPLVQVPPCIAKKSNLRAFLRKYPEKFFIHTEVSDFVHWVHRSTHPYQLPTFGDIAIEIGNFKHYEPAPFDWKAYRDVDDAHQIDDFEVIEAQMREKEILMNGGVDPAVEAAAAAAAAAAEEAAKKKAEDAQDQDAAELAAAMEAGDSIERKDSDDKADSKADRELDEVDAFQSTVADKEGEKMIEDMNALFGNVASK